MKNNLSLILNGVLLIAVAFLFIDRFSSSKPASNGQSSAESEAKADPLNIVYINLDSLHEKSATFQTKKTELEKRQASAEASLKSKGASFQREIAEYQKKAQSGTLTPKAMQDIEAGLAQKEQAIRQEQDRLTQDLMAETDKFNEQFTGQVKTFLDSLKKEMNYDYILIYGSGSPILAANDSLDITKTVLDYLNKK